jgi:hypothetical protein
MFYNQEDSQKKNHGYKIHPIVHKHVKCERGYISLEHTPSVPNYLSLFIETQILKKL